MNIEIDKLFIGQEFKNYGELCRFLNITPDTRGGSNLKQQKNELKRFFDFSQKGRKIIIESIYSVEAVKIDKRASNSIYLKHITDLVLYALRELDGEIGYVPVSRLLYLCEVVNSKYIENIYNKRNLAKELNMDVSYIEEFYARNHREFRQLIERALNSMERNKLIELNQLTFAKTRAIKIDSNGNDYIHEEHRLVLDEELKRVISITEDVLKEMNIDNFKELHLKHLYKEYKKKLEARLLSELGFYYTYKCYRIAPYKHRIIKAISNSEKELVSNELSNNIINKIDLESKKLHEKQYLKTFGKCGNIQSNVNYCENIRKIAEYVVRNNYFSLDKKIVNTDVYKKIKLASINDYDRFKK